MNPWRSPRWVLRQHAKDEFTQFPAHAFSTNGNTMPRNPLPIQLESCTVPADDRLGLQKHQGLLPARPEPAHKNPEDPVRSLEPRFWTPHLQNGKLLPQGQILQEQIATRRKGSDKRYEQKPQQAQHKDSLTRKIWRNRCTAI